MQTNLISLVKRPCTWVLKALDLHGLYSLKQRGPLLEDGWFRSHRENASVDASGAPLPWITYPAIEFILRRVKPDMSVFEYGSGGSTTWWADRAGEVVAVEHNREWFEKVSKSLNSRALVYQIDLVYGGEYSRAIQRFTGRFDVVVVDGRDRVNCIKNCLQALKPTGIIILDNSDRPEYAEAFEFLHSNGFRHIEFVGLCPIVNIKCETSIFYRSGNGFGI